MLKLSDSRNFSRTLAGIGLIVGPLLFLVAVIVSPANEDDTALYLEEVAANESAHVVSSFIFLAGAFFLVAGLIGVMHLMRGRTVTLGQFAAGLILLGVVTSSTFVGISIFEAALVDAQFDRAEMVALSEEAEESAGAVIFFVLFLVGIVLGSILLAVALWRRKAVPLWSPILILVSTVVSFIGGDSQALSIISFILLLGGFAGVGLKILSLSDEEWERWQALPERGAASEPPTPDESTRAPA